MTKKARRAPVLLADLAKRIIGPVAARRGFVTADLISAWPDIVGKRFERCTIPERITWPPRDPDQPGVLVLRVDGPVAVLIQHETDQIIERVNNFMGYRSIDRIRLVQGPVSAVGRPGRVETAPLGNAEQDRLDDSLSGFDTGDDLKAALARLGRGVLGRSG